MSSIAVSDKIIFISRENNVDCYDYSNHNIIQISKKDAAENIADLVISSNSNYLALITTSSKRLLIYELPELKNIKDVTLPRSASKINFANNNSQVFVADKTGDVFSYNVLNDESGKKLLGHLSLLLNVLHTKNGKYLITSDRDEKIKVSHYPNTYNIQTYCLGHKEFVNYIELLAHDDQYLVSASGDGTIKFWNYLTGAMCYTIDTNSDIDDQTLKDDFSKCMYQEGLEVSSLPLVHVTQTQISNNCTLLAASVYTYKKLLMYTFKTEHGKFTHKLETQITLGCNFPAAIKLHSTSLFVYEDVTAKLFKYEIFQDDNTINLKMVDKIQLFNNQQKNHITCNDIDSIKVLFKRKFDNVQEYQERKRQRLAKPPSNL